MTNSPAASRGAVIWSWGGHDRLTSRQKIEASSIAGGISGAAGGLLRRFSFLSFSDSHFFVFQLLI